MKITIGDTSPFEFELLDDLDGEESLATATAAELSFEGLFSATTEDGSLAINTSSNIVTWTPSAAQVSAMTAGTHKIQLSVTFGSTVRYSDPTYLVLVDPVQ